MDPDLSLPACQKADGNATWVLEKLLDLLPRAAEEPSFIEDGLLTNQLTLQPYRQEQASLFTGAGGLGLS